MPHSVGVCVSESMDTIIGLSRAQEILTLCVLKAVL